MKPNMPRSWFSLPKRERDSLQKVMTEQVYAVVDEEEKELQITWLKLACIVIHEVFGFGETRLLRFIAHWKRIYGRNRRCKTKEERDAWLDEEMKRLFPNGFPEERIEEMKEM